MTKKSTEPEDLEPDPLPAEFAAELQGMDPEAYPLDADGNPPPGAFLPGYRSALDNPAHPLHHLRDA